METAAEATSDAPPAVVTPDAVDRTIEAFTRLDQSGNRKAMEKLAQRLGKEQPALLQYAARVKTEHGDQLGEAAVFYGTLVWSMFDRAFDRALPRLTTQNLEDAAKLLDDELKFPDDKPAHERLAPSLVAKQPHLLGKLRELLEEDVREGAIPADGARLVIPPAQVIAEAFDAAVSGKRPGERLGPIVHTGPKVGRNDPCHCGSGKKFKRCHGS